MADKSEKNAIELLQQELENMKSLMQRSGFIPPETRSGPRPDFVEFGSDQHAAILGLAKAKPDDKLEYEGWTLVDPTAFGYVREDVINHILKSKVHILKAGPPPIPAEPTLWWPAPEDMSMPR